jgi:hypothetical protein
MVNKRFIGILPTLLAFFLIGCNTEKAIKNNFEEDMPEIISTNLDKELHPDYSNFKGFNLTTDNISFKIDGKPLTLTLPIYLDKNRYYISLNEFTDKLNGKIEKIDTLLIININNEIYSINLLSNTVNCLNNSFILKKTLLNENNIYYIEFFDFSHMLNLYTRWDKDNKIINCKTNGFNNLNITPYKSKINQIGFIRFEDIGLRSQSYCNDYFEKLRIISNYMNQKKIPYHIAWIPRYMIPSAGIDNDPLIKNNFEIAEMVYSLDFFSANNGIIGLHGYTHQLGNSESGVGFEFGRYDPSPTAFRTKIQKAIETASFLDIPINFFEVPHYSITPEQNKIAEEYFKILYYPFNDYGPLKTDLTKPQLSPYNKSSYYISTPLDYIPTGKEDITLTKFRNLNLKNMGSVFFHPSLEDNYISLTEDSNGAPTFTYKDNSTLKKLVDVLEYKGYKIIKVTDI